MKLKFLLAFTFAFGLWYGSNAVLGSFSQNLEELQASEEALVTEDIPVLLASEEDVSEEDVDFECAAYMIEHGNVLVDLYSQSMAEIFQQDVPSSDLIEKSSEFYRVIEYALTKIFEEGLDKTGYKSFDTSSSEVSYCAEVRDQYINYAQLVLSEQALQSGASKQTFIIVDGLKSINESLSDFQLDFANVFPVVFNKMSNALPCYARQCITK